MGGWAAGWTEGRKDRQPDGWVEGQTDGQMCGGAPTLPAAPSQSLPTAHGAPRPRPHWQGWGRSRPVSHPCRHSPHPATPWGWGSGGGVGGWESGQCQATPWPSVRPRPAGPQLQWLVLVEPHHVPRECPGTVKTPVLMVLSARPWQGELLRSTLQPPPAGAQGKLRHGGAGSTPGMDCGLQHGHPACGNSPRGKESAWGHGDRVFTRGMGGGPAPAWV